MPAAWNMIVSPTAAIPSARRSGACWLLAAAGAALALAGLAPGSLAAKPELKGRSEYHAFSHNGIQRGYLLYLPQDIGAGPLPLVMALHGGGGSSKKWATYTQYGFERLADDAPFILVYPDGLEGQWNDGREIKQSYAHRNHVDDLGFLSSLIEYLCNTLPVDRGRVFVTGASNGGMMALVLAARHPEQIAAIAPVIASIPARVAGSLAPSEPVSVLIMNGKEDPLVPWQGGFVKIGRQTRDQVIPTEQTVEFWRQVNGCGAEGMTTGLPDLDPGDGTRAWQTVYSGGRAGTEVWLIGIEGGGHTWPGRVEWRGPLLKAVASGFVGRKCRDFDATDVIWEFFRTHPKQVRTP